MLQTLQLRTRQVQKPVQAEQRQLASTAAVVKNASITQNHVTQVQSLEMMQTILHGAISALSYMRNLFPETCFDEQLYNANDVHFSYHDYASGSRMGKQASTKLGSSTLRALRRGRDKGVDCLLDWLECGAFDALKKNYLRALQLNLFEEHDHPSQVMETYTFTFRYTAVNGEHPRVADLELQGPRGDFITVRNVQLALQLLIRRLCVLCGAMPDLPEQRFLNIHLFYTDDCPADYEPPGFQRCVDNTMIFPRSDTWQRTQHNLGVKHTGYHSVGLKVSSLQKMIESTSGQSNDEVIPAGKLSYTDAVARDGEIGMSATEESTIEESEHALGGFLGAEALALQTAGAIASSTRSRRSQRNVELFHHETPFSAAETLVERHDPPNEANFARRQAAAISEAADTGTHLSNTSSETPSRVPVSLGLHDVVTQDSPAVLPDHAPERYAAANLSHDTFSFPNDASGWQSVQKQSQELEDSQTRRQIRGMLIPSSQGASYVETQVRESSDWQMDPNQNLCNLRTPDDREDQAIKLQFSQKRLDELEMRKSRLMAASNRPTRRSRGIVRGHSEEDIVKCQCGWNEDDGGMVQCSFCNAWQHVQCYGYCNVDDPRLPRDHVCYNCLLSEDEYPLLTELKGLALLRRGLRIIEVAGFNTTQRFAAELRCDLQTASNLFNCLRQEGYVVPARGKKSKGSSQTAKSKFCLASERDVLERMNKAYFDPTTKIAHHFEAPKITGPDLALPTQSDLPTQNQSTASIDTTGGPMEDVQSGEREPLDRASEETDELVASTAAPPRGPSHKAPSAGQEYWEVTGLPESQGRYSLRKSGVLGERNPNIGTPSPSVRRKRRPDNEDANSIPRSTRRKRLRSSRTTKALDVGDAE